MDNRYDRQTAPNGQARRPAPGQGPGIPGSPQRGPTGRPVQYRQQQPSPATARQPQRPSGRGIREKTENRWFRAILLVMVTVAISGFAALFILQSAFDMFGLNQIDKSIEVTIPDNPTVQQITPILSDAGVIDQPLTFRIYAIIKKDELYYGGEYVFNSNMGYDEILRDLRTQTSQNATVDLTFTEGENAYEIAQKLQKADVCTVEAFLEQMEKGDYSYEFMDRLPADDLRFHRLEGYLFPDTYRFYIGENVDSVVRKFLDNFTKKITTTHYDQMRSAGLTLDETIVLASIIQKEAGGIHGPDEMRRVSSVFHNRLNHAETYPKLQSDVTREYVDRFIKPFQDVKTQEMYDAYNTYACDGLPVGPICNPGIQAIEAALSPDETTEKPYYFFVTDVQDRFYYAATAKEHYSNVALAEKVEGEGEIHGIDTE